MEPPGASPPIFLLRPGPHKREARFRYNPRRSSRQKGDSHEADRWRPLGLLLGAEAASAQTAAKRPAQAPKAVPSPPATTPGLPSETPATFEPVTDSFDYVRREMMIPMRDGVKLHTVILVPRGAAGAPILLTRTPYDASALTSHAQSPHLGPILQGYDNATDVIVEGGYIRVVQDVRGKYGSEGD